MNASLEQQKIVDLVGKNNVIVDSVAGSGKTTTNLFIARRYREKQLLLLTYNKRLKDETTQKFEQNGIQNTAIHTFHSFCYQFYLRQEIKDKQIMQIVDNQLPALENFKYDLIIIDEAQDMSPLYYQLVLKICKENLSQINFTFCIIGDQKQCINKYIGADVRFIQLAEQVFGKLNPFPWERAYLTQSFRLTQEMCNFINDAVLNEQRIKSLKKGINLPRYLVCKAFEENNGKEKLIKEIINQIQKNQNLLENLEKLEQELKVNQSVVLEVLFYLAKGYKYEDIFIISPTVNENSPARFISNQLSKLNLPVFVASAEESSNESVFENKIVFLTYNKVKGLERKVTIVLNFDASYYKFYQKSSGNICSNTHYVAITRSSEQLTLIHFHNSNPNSFLNFEKLKLTTQIQVSFTIQNQQNPSENTPRFKPANLTSYLQQQIIDQAISYLQFEIVQKSEDTINIPKTTQQEFMARRFQIQKEQKVFINENVEEINEIAIIAMIDIISNTECFIFDQIRQIKSDSNNLFLLNQIDQKQQEIMNKIFNHQQNFISNPTIEDLLFICNYYSSLRNRKISLINQISVYNWVSQQQIDSCVKRLSNVIKPKSVFLNPIDLNNGNAILQSYQSCINDKEYWEIRYLDNIQQIHILQLAIQKYIRLKQIKNEKQVTINQIHKEFLKDKSHFIDGMKLSYSKGNKEKECTLIRIMNKDTAQIEKQSDKKKKFVSLSSLIHPDMKKLIDEQNELELNLQYSFKIINIRDNKIIVEKSTFSNLEKMVNFLVNQKCINKEDRDDNEIFMEQIQQFYSKCFSSSQSPPSLLMNQINENKT